MEKLKNKLQVFADNWWGKITLGLLSLALAYVFASWAIDSGSLLDYAITLLLVILGFRELLGALFSKRSSK